MGVSSLWPLAFLVLVPIIILLYILKQEAKPEDFSSTMLWKEVFRNIEAQKPWERFKKNILLLLQIITVVLLIFALMGPWIKAGKEQKQAILVIDNSASMEFLYTEEDSRLSCAKKAACDYVDSLPLNSSVYVICGNKQAQLVLSNSTDRVEIKNRINSIEQTNYAGDLSVTLGLIQSCITKSQDYDVVFYTDTQFDIGDLEASVQSFYSDYDNYSINLLSLAPKEDSLTILASIMNYTSKAGKREVNLYGRTQEGKKEMIDIKTAEVEAGESGGAFFELSNEQAEKYVAFMAEINEKDALSSDNFRWCANQEIKEKKVLLLSKSNMFIEKSMGNLPGITMERSDDLEILKGNTDYDLYIFDGIIPEELPKKGACLFINSEYKDLLTAKTMQKGAIVNIDESELSSFIANGTIGVNETILFDSTSWGEAFLSTNEGVAGVYGSWDGRKIAAIGFDLHQTDFCLQVEFPIMMSNLADYLLGGSIIDSDYCTVGDSMMIHGDSKGQDVIINLPSGEVNTLKAFESSGAYYEVSQMGCYSISQKNEGQEDIQYLAAGFPTETESWVESADNMLTNNMAREVDIKTGMMDIRKYILVILLVLLIAEWIVYIKLQ